MSDKQPGVMLTDNKVKLRSSDNVIFYVDEQVVNQLETVKNMIEVIGTDTVIPLPNVESKILVKIIEYCEHHEFSKMSIDGKPLPEDVVNQWDAEFVNVDKDTLFSIIVVANYLNIKNLLNLTCQTVADMINGKTPEEIRKLFNIVNDFTPEEEAEVSLENASAL